jgi:hypothetical protein
MLLAKRCSAARQGLLVQRLRLALLPHVIVEYRQIVLATGDVRVFLSENCSLDGQSLFEQWLHFGVLAYVIVE